MNKSFLLSVFASLATACAVTVSADDYNPATDWMAGSVGIFQHYLFSDPTDEALRKMRQFDAEGLAKQLEEIGADFFCPTLMQVRPSIAAPNDVFEDLTGHERGSCCSQFDIPAELIRAFKPRGIKLMLYAPASAPRHDPEACRRLGFKMSPNPGADPLFSRAGVENWGKVLEFWSRRYGKDIVGWWIDGCNRGAGFDAPDIRANEIYAKALKSGNPKSVVAFNPGFVLGKFVDEDDYTAGEINEPFMTVCPARWVQRRQWQLLTYTYQPLMFPNTVRYSDTEWIDWLGPVLSRGGCVMLDALGDVPTGIIPTDRAEQLKVVVRMARGEKPSDELAARLELERRIRRTTDLIDANAREHTHPERLRAFVAVEHARMEWTPDSALVYTNSSGECIWTAAIMKRLEEKGSVYIPPNVEPYRLDRPIVLKSGQSLTGGGLRYPLRDGYSAKLMPAKGYTGPLLVCKDSAGVHVRGPIFYDTVNPVQFENVDGLSVREIAFRNCGATAVTLRNCRNFRVDAVRVEDAAEAETGVKVDEASSVGMVRNVSIVGAPSVTPVRAAGRELIVSCNGNIAVPKAAKKRMAAFDYVIAGEPRCRIEPSGDAVVDAAVSTFTNLLCRCTGVTVPVRKAISLTETLSRMTFDVKDSGSDFYSITYPKAGHMLVSGTAKGCRWALMRMLCDDLGVVFTEKGVECPSVRNATAASKPDHSAPFERSATVSPVPANLVGFSRVTADVSALPEEMRFVGGLLTVRVEERTAPSDVGEVFRVVYSLDTSVPEGEARVAVSNGLATVRAARMIGLVHGTGRLLKSFRYGADVFRATDGACDFRAAKGFRMAYIAMHFLNGFMDMPTDEILRYMDDLALDGINRFTFSRAMNAVDVAEGTAAEKEAYRKRSLAMLARVSALGCGYCTGGGSNQLPTDSDEALRGEPNDNPKAPSTGFNACPAKPAAMKRLLERRRSSLEGLKDVDVKGFYYWPYDEGGCGCRTCRPWGANGFLKMCERFYELNNAAFPDAKAILSTWFFTDKEYEGLWKYLEKNDWIDYLIVDDFGPEFPRYPLEHPIPGKTRIITFPEISMWGRSPWGGYGATALPKFLERLYRQCEHAVDGFDYYAEGLYEDLNKWIVTSLYVDPSSKTDDLLAQYAAYHFAGCDPADYVELANLLEKNHRPIRMRGEDVARAVVLADRIDAAILPSLRNSWRWRLTWLRTRVDAEIVRTGEFSPASATGYFDEIVRISSCERQARRIWSGRNGGWTCPRYFPKDRIRILTPPEGDATAMLRREISDPVIARIWLGAGKWNVGSLAVDRRRLTLTLLDGAVLASPTGTFTVGEGVCDISVLGEGSARIDMPVLFSGVTNAVLRGVAVKDGDVRVRRSEGVVVDLPLSGFKMPTRAVKSELDRVDAAAEWAEQHLEFEKAERLHSVIRKLDSETNE